MKLKHIDTRTGGALHFIHQESAFANDFQSDGGEKLFTLVLNTGEEQTVIIDGVAVSFPAWYMLPLFTNQSFRFEKPEQLTAWQYNRDFYCILDHDKEVSCIGLLFFGSFGNLLIELDETHRRKIDILLRTFMEEFDTADNIQTDMLQMLLKRLIIITTRLARQQYAGQQAAEEKLDIIRQYNFLVEMNYKTQHQVQFYATQLNKSPKTLSNLFAQYNRKSPLTIIHERIITEAKRLFFYTDKSAKEVAYELGFEDAAHFSRFFKNFTNQSPSELKKAYQTSSVPTDIPAISSVEAQG